MITEGDEGTGPALTDPISGDDEAIAGWNAVGADAGEADQTIEPTAMPARAMMASPSADDGTRGFAPFNMGEFSLMNSLPEEGSVSKAENTADDKVVYVGEDDDPAKDAEPIKVLKDWEVTGSGKITVEVGGVGKGTLSHTDGSLPLTFTGTAAEVNDWLDGIRYQYKITEQSQTGDSDSITLTFRTFDGEGVERVLVTRTQAIEIAPQNDAPTVSQNGKTIAEVLEVLADGKGGVLSFGAPEVVGNGFIHDLLGISDPDNLAEQVIIKLESIPDPTHGSLVLTLGNGHEVTLAIGSTLSVQDLANLKYVTTGKQVSPANGEAATPLQSFKFTIDDGAGGRLTGQEVFIKLIPVNQAPSVSGGVVIIEGEPGPNGRGVSLGLDSKLPVIGGDRGAIVGVDSDDSNLTYEITELPKYGTLFYGEKKLDENNIGDKTPITDLSLLTYLYSDEHEPGGTRSTHDEGEKGQDSFVIKVKDAGGGAGSEAILAQEVPITITILDNNDDPYFDFGEGVGMPAPGDDGKITLGTLDYGTATKDGNSIIITKEMLPLKDSDSFNANLVFTITGSNVSKSGYFTVDGKLLNVSGDGKGASFTYQDVIDSKVEYHLFGTGGDERTDYIDFTVKDSGISILFDGAGNGAKRDGGIYKGPEVNAQLQVFRFQVKVPASTPGGVGGEDLPDLPGIATGFTVAGDQNFIILEGAGNSGNSLGYTLTTDDLNTTDTVSQPKEIVYRLETVPGSGTLYLGTVALTQFDSFTQQDIIDGSVVFKHGGGEHFDDQFQFSVSNGTITTGSAEHFVTIKVTPQNDTPSASQGHTINVLEGEKVVINGENLPHIVLSDSDEGANTDGYDNKNILTFVVTGLPEHGKLYLEGREEPLNVGDTITQEALNSGKLSYKHDGGEEFTDSFKIQPYDNQNVSLKAGDAGHNTGTGITDTNRPSKGAETTINITIAPVNDAPVYNNKQHLTGNHALYEGQEAIIWGKNPSSPGNVYGQLIYTDQDNTETQTQYRITKATEYGQLYKGSVALKEGSIFTQADLDAGLIKYVHNGGEGHTDTFEYTVSDGDFRVNDAGAGANEAGTTPKSSVFEIQIKPTNDKPEIIAKPSAPIVVDGKHDQILTAVPGFKVADKDLPVGKDLVEGEKDLVTVIVRVVDKDGKPIESDKYTLEMGNLQSGTNGYLVLTGSVKDVNTALEGLKVGFSGAVPDGIYRLEVIVDDRLDSDGKHRNGGAGVIANGGDKNHKDGLPVVDVTEYKWTIDSTTTLEGSFNLAVSHQDIWVSSVNDKPELAVSGPLTVNEDVPYKITGNGWTVTDRESTTFETPLTVTISTGDNDALYGTLDARGLPSGVTVSGNGSGSITLTGTQADLDAYLKSTVSGVGVFYTTAKDVNHDVNGESVAGDVTLTVTLSEKGFVNSGSPDSGGSVIGSNEGASTSNESVKNADDVKTIALTVNAVNDAPSIAKPEGGTLTIDSAEPFDAGKFVLSDVDANDGYDVPSGEENGKIQVTVRITDKDGKPLNEQAYIGSGISFGSSNAQGAELDKVLKGESGVLRIYGTLEQVQAYLDNLQVQFVNAGNSNLDGNYKLEVIVDDRLYEKNANDEWVLRTGGNDKPLANGGAVNQQGTDPLPEVSANTFDVYGETKAADFGIFNVASATRDLYISSQNDPAVIGINGDYESDKNTLTDVETVDKNTVTLKGLTIYDQDAQPDDILDVTVTLPDGFTFANNDNGTLSDGDKTITLSGTLAEINAWMSSVIINLPDVDGAGDNAQDHDWNGSFDFKVTVNDRGNTGVTPPTPPASENGNSFKIGDYGGKPAIITERTLTFTVAPTNDAPVVVLPGGQTGAKEILTAVDEDFSNSAAPTPGQKNTVADLFDKYFDDSRDQIDNPSRTGVDAVDGTKPDVFWGVAVVGNDALGDHGKWQYYDRLTSKWVDIPTTVGDGSALLLDKGTAIQFVPNKDWNGTPGDLTVRLVENNDNGDSTSSVVEDLISGKVVNITTGGGVGNTSLYSADTVALGTQVNAINDAPTINKDLNEPKITVGEDKQNPVEPNKVEDLFKQYFNDNADEVAGGSDKNGFAGVAIVGVSDSENGTWQYDNGSGWTDLPDGITDGSAFVLTPNDQLRFVPNANYNGTPDASVTVRLIDGTGTAKSGDRVDVADDKAGGTTPYSEAGVTLTVEVTPENDPPTLTVGDKTTGIEVEAWEKDGVTGSGNAIEVKLLTDVKVGDDDLSTTDGIGGVNKDIFGAGKIEVKLTNPISGDGLSVAPMDGMDVTNGAPVYNAETGMLTIELTEGATTAQVQAILAAVTYVHTTDDPTNLKGEDSSRSSLDFTVTLSDGNNVQGAGKNAGGPSPLSAVVTGTITLIAANDPPTAVEDKNTLTNQKDKVTGNLIAGTSIDGEGAGSTGTPDSDPDTPYGDLKIVNIEVKTPGHGNDTSSVEVKDGDVIIQGKYGVLTVHPDGTYTYDLDKNNPDVYGQGKTDPDLKESFEYTLSDGGNGVATAELIITITGAEPKPSSIVPEDHNGTVDANGHNTVDEKGLRSGSDDDDSDVVTGNITVKAHSGIDSVTIGSENITLDKLKNASSNSPIAITTEHGTLEIIGFKPAEGQNPNAPREGTIEYRYTLKGRVDHSDPANGDDKIDSIALKVSGKTGDPGTGTLDIQIIDDTPQAEHDGNGVTRSQPEAEGNVFTNDEIGADRPRDPDSPVTGVAVGELVNAGDVPIDGSGLGPDGITGQYGKLILGANGQYTYELNLENRDVKALKGSDAPLTDIFTYTITDADGDTAMATLTITIYGNSDPVANPDVRTTPEDTPVSGNVIKDGGPGDQPDSDPDAGDTLKVTQFVVGDTTVVVKPGIPGTTSIPDVGTITIYEDGSYIFTPVPDWNGSVPLITYTVDDGNGGTATSTLTITVTPVPDAVDDRTTTTVDVPVVIDPLNNDSFEGKDPKVSVGSGDGPSNGTITVHPDGTITYTPNPGFIGEDTFTYTVTSGGTTETATVTITVTNQPPVAQPDMNTVPEDTPATGNVLTNDRDPDGHPVEVTDFTVQGKTYSPGSTVDIPGVGTITLGKDGGYTFVPVPDWNGSVPPIGYTITDGKGSTDTSTLTITVTPVPDAVNDRTTTTVDVPVVIDPLDNDSFEGDNPKVSVEPGDGPSNGTVTVHPDGSITYTPSPGFVGEDTFTYTVTSGGVTEKAVVTIVVGSADPVDPSEPVSPIDPEGGGGTPGEGPGTPQPVDPQDDIRYYYPTNPGTGTTFSPSASAGSSSIHQAALNARSPVRGDQVRDPSVFFDGGVYNKLPRVALPFHPIVYVNREVQEAQNERRATDFRSQSNTFWSQPGVVGSVSIGSGLGQDPNLFVEHAVRSAQGQSDFIDAVVLGRLGRIGLGADGELPIPDLAPPLPTALAPTQARPEPQQDQAAVGDGQGGTDAGEQASADDLTLTPATTEDNQLAEARQISHAAPSFSEQLRGGSGRLPVALHAPKDLS
ncbi:tandem-95 repeat protein [Alcaligenaceae bacterium]|nr:tandem-95 repeat protein [Alcaligenaceae bacterium]